MARYCELHIRYAELGWRCANCSTDIAKERDLIPGRFNGRTGRAVFISEVINVRRGETEMAQMSTGKYKVQEIRCINCDLYIGWVYVESIDPRYRYKEGKFCLECSGLYQLHDHGSDSDSC